MKNSTTIIYFAMTITLIFQTVRSFSGISLQRSLLRISTSLKVASIRADPFTAASEAMLSPKFFTEESLLSSTDTKLPSANSYDGICCDMDGVLWLGNEEISQSIDALKVLKFSGKSIVFVTNNSAKTKLNIQDKLKSLGYDASI